MNEGPDDRRIIIPFTTFQSIYGDKYLDEMLVKRVRPQDGMIVEQEIRRVLSRKYQFDRTDDRFFDLLAYFCHFLLTNMDCS